MVFELGSDMTSVIDKAMSVNGCEEKIEINKYEICFILRLEL